MRKFAFIFFVMFSTATLFAYNPKKTNVEDMYKEVSKTLGHKIEKYEQNIIDTTYFYYSRKINGEWTKETWNDTVLKCIELCNNNTAVGAAKASEFGEKVLQSLIITTEDAWTVFNGWINKKSEEYNERHK